MRFIAKMACFVIALLMALEQMLWAQPGRSALAPGSLFEDKKEQVTPDNIQRHLGRMVYFFSMERPAPNRLLLTQKLARKTHFQQQPILGKTGFRRDTIALTAAMAVTCTSVIMCLISAQYADAALVFAMGTGITFWALQKALRPYMHLGFITAQDFWPSQWKKLWYFLSLAENADAIAYTAAVSRFGQEEFEGMHVQQSHPHLEAHVAHETMHALRFLDELNISHPAHEMILANALFAYFETEEHGMVFTPILLEKLSPQEMNDDAIGKVADEFMDKIQLEDILKTDPAADTFGRIHDSVRAFSKAFQQQDAILAREGLHKDTEHYMPVHLQALLWARLAARYGERRFGKMGALVVLKNFAASPPTKNDGDVRAIISRSLQEAETIIQNYEDRTRRLELRKRATVLKLVREGFMDEAEEMLGEFPIPLDSRRMPSALWIEDAVSEQKGREMAALKKKLKDACEEIPALIYHKEKKAKYLEKIPEIARAALRVNPDTPWMIVDARAAKDVRDRSLQEAADTGATLIAIGDFLDVWNFYQKTAQVSRSLARRIYGVNPEQIPKAFLNIEPLPEEALPLAPFHLWAGDYLKHLRIEAKQVGSFHQAGVETGGRYRIRVFLGNTEITSSADRDSFTILGDRLTLARFMLQKAYQGLGLSDEIIKFIRQTHPDKQIVVQTVYPESESFLRRMAEAGYIDVFPSDFSLRPKTLDGMMAGEQAA